MQDLKNIDGIQIDQNKKCMQTQLNFEGDKTQDGAEDNGVGNELTNRYKQDRNSTYGCALRGLSIYNLFNLFSL